MINPDKKRCEEIENRLAAATPGPWYAGNEPDQFGDECVWLKDCNQDDIEDAEWLMNVNSHGDAQLIANAPSDIGYLLDLARRYVDRIENQGLELHQQKLEINKLKNELFNANSQANLDKFGGAF